MRDDHGEPGRQLTLTDDRIPAQFGHIPSLDGLRAISILLVMFAHFVSKNFPGGLGVYIFFVISGFLIARLMFAERTRDHTTSLRRFYLRRAIRLYPVVIVYTVFVVGVYLAIGAPIDWRQPASGLFYFANFLYPRLAFLTPAAAMPFAIFWSLSIEEHFYLLFPGLFRTVRGQAKRVLTAMVVVCLSCLGLRLSIALLHPELVSTSIFYSDSEFRLDSIAFGVALAAMCELERGRQWIVSLARRPVFVGTLVLLFGCLAYRGPFFRETVRYSLLGGAITVLLIGVLFSPRLSMLQSVLNARPLVWIGRLSYSLYVWHLLAPRLIENCLPRLSNQYAVPLKFVLAFAIAAASYYALEQPFTALRRRLERSQ
jgi:peptidoglycan/LPS O-acetylase OafA/YrhL